MRRLIGFAFAAAVAAFAISGCGGKQLDTAVEDKCVIDGAEAPKWVCIPYFDDKTIAGVGSAHKNKGNDYNFQRNQAELEARNSIALSISTNVRAAIDSWQRNTGLGEDSIFEQNKENVSRQTTFQYIKGTKTVNVWSHPSSGALFVLMIAPLDQSENAMITSLRNENALWQQFQSQKAQEQLKEEFEKAIQR
jgi:hypothetical protein